MGICSTFGHFLLQNVNHGSCRKSVFIVPFDKGKKQNTAASVKTEDELHLWNKACVALFCALDIADMVCWMSSAM